VAQQRPVAKIADDAIGEILAGSRGDREASIETDKSYYDAGEVIVVAGSGFDVGEVVTLVLHEEPTTRKDRKVSVVADAFGNIFDNQFTREGSEKGVTFYLTARGESSGLTTQRVLANPSADLDQCANGSLSNPDATPCQSSNEWVNGNLGGSKAHYNEGDSVPYRLRFGNLSLASHTVTIEWDTTKSDKHALDYVTTFNRTVGPNADPCVGVNGCVLAGFTAFAIPKDPQVDNGSGSPIPQLPGDFRFYGGTITGVSAYSYPDGDGFTGDKSARISITFTPSVANPVLAWGGHISTRINWGTGSSCVAIPGSPFHTRLIDLDGSGGNQDRSLSSDAVTFPGSITIIKDASPSDAQDFGFTTTGGLSPATFSLDDDGDGTLSDTQTYSDIKTFTSYGVSETAVSGWTLSLASPPCTVTSPNGGGSSSSGSTVTINMKEGENYTCTFTNTRQAANLTVTKVVTNNTNGTKQAGDFPLFVDSTLVTTGVQNEFAPGSHVVSETQQSGYSLVSITGDCDSDGNVTLVAGQSKSCTITNTPIAPKLTVTKVVTDNTNGTKQAGDFPLFVDSTSVTTGVENTFALGAHVVSETQQTGYSLVSITGDCDGDGNVTLNPGDTKSCTITNTPIAPKLTVTKVVINDNGGSLEAADFPLFVDATGVTSGVQNTFSVGPHTVSETPQTGYTQTGIGGDCAADGSITLNPGDVKSCTITNDDSLAGTLVKTTLSWTLKDAADLGNDLIRSDTDCPTHGTITFYLYRYDLGTDKALLTCGEAALIWPSDPITETSGDSLNPNHGEASTSHDVDQPGIYLWVAVYSGDNCNSGSTSGCGAEVTEITDESPLGASLLCDAPPPSD
jgi:hypothetical protein